MSKSKRRRFVGAYSEPLAPPIGLPLTVVSFRTLLIEGAQPNSQFTHQQIKDWAAKFWAHYHLEFSGSRTEAHAEMAASTIAQDIEVQWDMSLANTHTIEELQHLDFSQVRLPQQWFADWLDQLNLITSPDARE